MFGVKTQVTQLNNRIEYLETEIKKRGEWFDDLKRKYEIEKEDMGREMARLKDAENILKKKFDEEKALAFKTMELEFKGKLQDEVQRIRNEADQKLQKGLEENFTQLKEQLSKLHSEGNAQTKFTEQIALKMMSVLKPTAPQITNGMDRTEE